MTTREGRTGEGRNGGAWPYLQVMRVDHWFKNVFVLPGVLLGLALSPTGLAHLRLAQVAMALLATCLVASSNYTINEFLDAPFDRRHPVKHNRPAARGLLDRHWVIAQWLLLAAAGIGLAWLVHPYVAASAAWLWLMGIVYNVRPLRSKELPYLDVLSEAVNNPIRLFIGWFTVEATRFPPLSLAIAYWMVGAFFMATKRFAEYRRIADPATAAAYRGSFRHYDERRLLVSLFFYAQLSALFTGVFIVRYHLELILAIPLVAGFLAWYLSIGLQRDSAAQNPEKLYRERGFVAYAAVCVLLLVALLFTRIPWLYDAFKVPQNAVTPLWVLEDPRLEGAGQP